VKGPVSSGPTVVRGIVDSDEGALPPVKWCMT
jgi:hypothetical protein